MAGVAGTDQSKDDVAGGRVGNNTYTVHDSATRRNDVESEVRRRTASEKKNPASGCISN